MIPLLPCGQDVPLLLPFMHSSPSSSSLLLYVSQEEEANGVAGILCHYTPIIYPPSLACLFHAHGQHPHTFPHTPVVVASLLALLLILLTCMTMLACVPPWNTCVRLISNSVSAMPNSKPRYFPNFLCDIGVVPMVGLSAALICTC